jgi:hypothetical protein
MARGFQGEQLPIPAMQTPYYSSVEALTGAMQPLDPFQGKAPGHRAGGHHRQVVNLLSVIVALFVPWLIFIITFAVLTFSLHYEQAMVAYSINALSLMFVLLLGLQAQDARKKRRSEPTFHVFTFATAFLAWSTAVVFGDYNFYHYMQPFYDLYNLNSYRAIDPALDKGQRLMDAGQVTFVPFAGLDMTKSMGFKNLDTYCVVPISKRSRNSTSFQQLANYDFWAIGINCCAGNSGGDFRCGEYSNPNVHSGLRLMKEEQRAFFRLAVQQAEAAFNIKAAHPLFLHWMQDPGTEMYAYQDSGFAFFVLGVMYYFAVQSFLVGGAVLLMIHMSHHPIVIQI